MQVVLLFTLHKASRKVIRMGRITIFDEIIWPLVSVCFGDESRMLIVIDGMVSPRIPTRPLPSFMKARSSEFFDDGLEVPDASFLSDCYQRTKPLTVRHQVLLLT